MSLKSKSISSKNSLNEDERLKKISPLRVLLNRPELGALGGSILVCLAPMECLISSMFQLI
jgi:simple sugar transport system permease protein